MDDTTLPPSQEAIESADKLYEEIKDAFPEAVGNFEATWEAWQAVCLASYLPLPTPSSADEALSPELASAEYAAIKALGPKILPMVVHKLAHWHTSEQDLIGVYLYKALDKGFVFRPDELSPYNLKKMLRLVSTRIVEMNYERITEFESSVEAWKQVADTEHDAPGDTPERLQVLQMGPSIIAPAILEYSRNDKCVWNDLIHEIIHGHKIESDDSLAYLAVLTPWFNEGEWEDAPKWIPGEVERQDDDEDMDEDATAEESPEKAGRWGTARDPS